MCAVVTPFFTANTSCSPGCTNSCAGLGAMKQPHAEAPRSTPSAPAAMQRRNPATRFIDYLHEIRRSQLSKAEGGKAKQPRIVAERVGTKTQQRRSPHGA